MNDKFVKLKTPFSAHCISDQKVQTVVVRSVQKAYKNCASDQIQWSEMTKIFDHYCSVKILCQKRSEQLWSQLYKKCIFDQKFWAKISWSEVYIKTAFLTKLNGQRWPKFFTTTVTTETIVSKCCVKL